MKLVDDVLDGNVSESRGRKGTGYKVVHCTAWRLDGVVNSRGVNRDREGAPRGLGTLIEFEEIIRKPYSRLRG